MKNLSFKNSLLILFIGTMICVPLSWLTVNKPTGRVSLIEARYLSVFPDPNFQRIKTGVKRIIQWKPEEATTLIIGQFQDRSFQEKFEVASTDQFPLRMSLIQTSRALDRSFIRLAYSLLPDPAIPADMDSGIFNLRDQPRLIRGPDNFSENTPNDVGLYIENLEYLINKYPEISFYTLLYERVSGSKHHPLNKYFPQSDQGRTFEYFKDHKPNNLEVAELSFVNFEDLSSNYYKTDHHWNIRGVVKAYQFVYSMISKDYGNISPLLDTKNIHEVPGIKFYGSYARRTLFPMEGEKFEIITSNFPHFKVIPGDDDSRISPWVNFSQFKFSKKDFANHYGNMFGNGNESLEFINENEASRNLMIIGSSFARPLLPFMASHYKHTYYIDLRYLNDFSFSEFIQTHHVDDVLILADNYVLTNDIWIIDP